jgi:FtsP/CotA-like multicopper oxidase with cupredoxin domain
MHRTETTTELNKTLRKGVFLMGAPVRQRRYSLQCGSTAAPRTTTPATWLLHCHVNDHVLAGMTTKYMIGP